MRPDEGEGGSGAGGQPGGRLPRGGRRRVFVTGVGLVTPLGIGEEMFWRLVRGESGVGRISRFDPSPFPVQIAAEVNQDLTAWLDHRTLRHMDRFVQLSLVAAELARKDAGLEGGDLRDAGVVMGTGIGGLATLEAQHQVLLEKGPGRVSPFTVPAMIPNMAAGQVAIALGAMGPNMCVVTACASGAHAIGEAFRLVAAGEAEVCFAGGSEASITPLSLASFCNMRALSTRNDDPARASRPFDRARDGFVMGEGAGILLLESEEHARARSARIYAEVLGYGASADAHHLTAPHPEGTGAARAMQRALQDAGVSPEEVDHINAHATGTPLGDVAEAKAILAVFGDRAEKIPVTAPKGALGHLLGAAGAVETAVTVFSIVTGLIPPTLNCEEKDPDCPLDVVVGEPRACEVRVAVNNSFGFGGQNASLVLGRAG